MKQRFPDFVPAARWAFLKDRPDLWDTVPCGRCKGHESESCPSCGGLGLEQSLNRLGAQIVLDVEPLAKASDFRRW